MIQFIEKSEHPREKLLKEQVKRRETMVNTYTSLSGYWSDRRMIGSSSRMNQSEELIQEQLLNSKRLTEHHQTQLDDYLSELKRIKE